MFKSLLLHRLGHRSPRQYVVWLLNPPDTRVEEWGSKASDAFGVREPEYSCIEADVRPNPVTAIGLSLSCSMQVAQGITHAHHGFLLS